MSCNEVVLEIKLTVDEELKNLLEKELKNIKISLKTVNEEEQHLRKSIFDEDKSYKRCMIVDPYSYREKKTVDKSFPKKIKKAWEQNDINFCYFPVEPFHYRESKRHATQLAIEVCLEKDIPISLETRRHIPDWAISAIASNKMSEVRISINTLDEKKWHKLYPDASNPKDLVENFMRCFDAGAKAILKIAPIVPSIIEPTDVFEVVNAVKNRVKIVEVLFISFEDETEIKNLIGDESFSKYYENVLGRWYVKESYRIEFLKMLKEFTEGLRLKFKSLNESYLKDSELTVIKF